MPLAPSHRFDGDTQIQGSLDVANNLTIGGVAVSAGGGGIPAGTVTSGGLWWDGAAWVNALAVAANIDALAVTTAKIDNLAVTAGKLASSAVTNAKVDAAAAIADSKLAITDRAQEPYGPYPPSLMTTALGVTANHARGIRWKVPKTGTISDMMVYTAVASGNIMLGIYDTAATTRNRIAVTASTASGVTQGYQSIALAVNLAVVAGDYVDLALWADNGTVTFGRWSAILSNNIAGPLPAGYMGGAGASWLMWDANPGAGGLPATQAESGFVVLAPMGIWVKYA